MATVSFLLQPVLQQMSARAVKCFSSHKIKIPDTTKIMAKLIACEILRFRNRT